MENEFKVSVSSKGIMYLCLPDGTIIPRQIDSYCRQSLDQSKNGLCTFIVKIYLLDGVKVEDHNFGHYTLPALIINEKAYGIDKFTSFPEGMYDPDVAIIEVTASLKSL